MSKLTICLLSLPLIPFNLIYVVLSLGETLMIHRLLHLCSVSIALSTLTSCITKKSSNQPTGPALSPSYFLSTSSYISDAVLLSHYKSFRLGANLERTACRASRYRLQASRYPRRTSPPIRPADSGRNGYQHLLSPSSSSLCCFSVSVSTAFFESNSSTTSCERKWEW